ncbi:hypothetical protein Kisp01_64590 [Kineosporia sp. NBRC 101677]|nr:hypothetical protein Kisp01_64590 [Kineosporia sp. NBRC 101677]
MFKFGRRHSTRGPRAGMRRHPVTLFKGRQNRLVTPALNLGGFGDHALSQFSRAGCVPKSDPEVFRKAVTALTPRLVCPDISGPRRPDRVHARLEPTYPVRRTRLDLEKTM